MAKLIDEIIVSEEWKTHWNYFDGAKTEAELQALENLLYATFERVILQIGYYESAVSKQ